MHREIVAPSGVTFTSRRADDEQQSEFLASTDNWFRPVMVRTGPDGGLWIADMYRFVIEHPEWIPKDWQRRLDLRAGDNRGRIYRVVPENTKPREVPRLDKLDTAGLAAELESPNGWIRNMAQQMLVWRNDPGSVEPLRALIQNAQRPTAALHALSTLDGLDAIQPEDLLRGLAHRHPAVRRHAVRFSETREVELWFGLSALLFLDDADAQVRLQFAYSLGEWKNPALRKDVAKALAGILMAQSSDRYMRAAAMSSLHGDNIGDVIAFVLADVNQTGIGKIAGQLLLMANAMGDDDAVKTALREITRIREGRCAAWQLSAVAELLDARERQKIKLDWVTMTDIVSLVEHARRISGDETNSDEDRAAAIRLLGRRDLASDQDVMRIAKLLSPRASLSLQSQAVEALVRIGSTDTTDTLLQNWSAHSPNLRHQILDALLGRATWTGELLAALESKQLRSSDIDASRRQRLLTHDSDELRRRAENVFAGAPDDDRQVVVERYHGSLKLKGDDVQGKAVFTKRCATCHRLDNEGYDVGPDLAALTDRSPHALLVAMFDPNRAVEDKFLDYHLITDDGRQLTGIVVEETGNSITLRAADGKQQTVLRAHIDQMRSSGKSLMPEGMERDLSQQDTADLIAYLRRIGPPPKQFPGNKPVMITADDQGILRLAASAARIYGPRIVFEQKYRNLGWWAQERDYAAWSLVIPRSGRYRIILDYASHQDAAGDRFRLSVAGESRTGVVESTGSWDEYREKEIDTLDLPAGAAELVFRSEGPVRSALIDLRAVRLEPAKE